MGDFIDRNGIGLTNLEIFMCNGDYKAALKMLLDKIEKAPAADVAPVRHGRWINGRCSECGEHAPFWSMASTYHLSKYCHGCGAKMDVSITNVEEMDGGTDE